MKLVFCYPLFSSIWLNLAKLFLWKRSCGKGKSELVLSWGWWVLWVLASFIPPYPLCPLPSVSTYYHNLSCFFPLFTLLALGSDLIGKQFKPRKGIDLIVFKPCWKLNLRRLFCLSILCVLIFPRRYIWYCIFSVKWWFLRFALL